MSLFFSPFLFFSSSVLSTTSTNVYTFYSIRASLVLSWVWRMGGKQVGENKERVEDDDVGEILYSAGWSKRYSKVKVDG